MNHLTELVKVRPEDLPQRVEALMVKLKDAERELERVRKAQLSTSIEGIIGTGADIGPFRLWTFTLPDNLEAKDLRDVVLRARGMTRAEIPVAILGAAVTGGKVALVAAANDTAQAQGLGANALLQAALPEVAGRGGGKADVAQGAAPGPRGSTPGSPPPRSTCAGLAADAGEPMSFRRGVRLGVDVGSVRIGVARCDPDGILATPVGTVPRGDGDLQRLAELAREHEAVEIVVGLPVTLKGERGPAPRPLPISPPRCRGSSTLR